MNIAWTAWTDIAASRDLQVGIGPFVAGLAVVALLIGAFVIGARIRRREPAPPRPEEQPRLPEGGPVHEVREYREPDEVPQGRHRLTPHRLKGHGNSGTRTSPTQTRPRWDEGSSGAFGSGSPGRH
ncbi:DUF6479 family protein [Streptomyces echinoruber]|jgi:hypothetical protein|uniref:Secreted protein n=1 Tax=Streptomyces echinoruber TaxID=68898 RepID=A0A918VH33_9ACTN|nr:DUF6479 family protein [Streptomyces echinoruber]GGZ96207.1 hypothetical protein GCM10010389_39330 [Streptomyces echinoruber]